MSRNTTRSQPSWSDPARGIARLPDPRVWGTLIGASGGTVFVFANTDALDEPWSVIAAGACAIALLAYVWFVFLVQRRFGPVVPVRPAAGLVYLGSVLAMLAGIRIGSVLLEAADRTSLRPAVIVVAVGLHFLPFAAAFHTRLFVQLGSAIVPIGGLGLALGWVWREEAAAWAAVIAGLVMITMIAAAAAFARVSRGDQTS